MKIFLSKNNKLFLTLFISVIFLSALCIYFTPFWHANDDIGMSMIAHGYGAVATASPKLIFSNIIWGYFVQSIPQINGVLGYSIVTLGILVIFGVVILYTLRELSSLGWFLSITVLAFVSTRPILFPQFTLNAGLVTVGAICCWYLYANKGSRSALLCGYLLAFIGFLVRSPQFLLILLIASPLLPWKKMFQDRFAIIAALSLLLAIGSAMFADYQAYQGEDWSAFNTLNPVRARFTDFGVGSILKSHSEILSQYGYTANGS